MMRIYLDTSVIGGVFAKAFSIDTKSLFAKVNSQEAVILVSTLLK